MSFLGTIQTDLPMDAEEEGSACLRPLLFLDFEASSLSRGSWPIEIGWAWIENGVVRSGSRVIAPRPSWPLSDWSGAAQKVHGIGIREVLAGTPAELVAAMTDRFASYDVLSDNPIWEQQWLDRLREGRPGIPVQPLRQAIADRMEPHEADWFRCALFRRTPAHRADPDAALLADCWLAAIRGDLVAAC
jgi:hypothetical protein